MGRCIAFRPHPLLRLALILWFPGFTAIVNKTLTAKYDKLVAGAPELIKTLPWGPDYEVDVFRKPDFTGLYILFNVTNWTHLIFVLPALEVVNFATGGIPAGINVSHWPRTYIVC